MSESATKAVFLSYASQDAGAAQRICDALQAAGVEVWLDKSELVGGDSWDAQIRRQIKECALFVPIISGNTQARAEGYFRLEWHLAEQRTLLMAHDEPFLLPVVIDDTPDAAARVPEKFRTVQWTRLPGGAPTIAFQARVRNLLGQDTATKPEMSPAATLRPETLAAAPRRRALPLIAAGAVAALLVATAAFLALRPHGNGSAAPPLGARSVAVLPLVNMSDDKDNAYFADGVHEDILTNAALIRGLRVVSRTTVGQYRDTKLSLRQIGEALGVAYVLEGSVRGRGNKVRVTVQLIDARTDEHVWAQSYDRDMSDVFTIQTELAKEIAVAMQTAITEKN